jgi:hypothetical protein
MIMAYLLSAAVLANDGNNASFWSVLYGFAVMLAIFDVINLKIRWPAVFGCLAYSVLAVKISSTPVTTSAVTTGPMQICGLIVAAIYCLCLVVFSVKKERNSEPDGQKV